MISPGVPALTRSRIRHVSEKYVRAETHTAANTPLITGQAGLVMAQAWATVVAAVDGTRFVVPVRSIDARTNLRYFGHRKGTTLLNMANDQGMGFAGMVRSGTPRDSLYTIDLMYRREGSPCPEAFISYTGSYSDMVFGLPPPARRVLPARGGGSARPEALAHRPERRLRARRRGGPRPNRPGPGAAALWPDILQLAASVHSGEICASDAMRMLHHGGNPTHLGDALAQYGRIFKTLHVVSYVDRDSYRREIKRMCNLQKGRHGLGKHIFHGRRGELREAYHAGMEDQLGALRLVLNCITLWNTVYLDAILDRLRAEGNQVRREDVARLSPTCTSTSMSTGPTAFPPATSAPTDANCAIPTARTLTTINARPFENTRRYARFRALRPWCGCTHRTCCPPACGRPHQLGRLGSRSARWGWSRANGRLR
ncbi:Tn3 family transposase [Nocardia gamkensis]